MNTNGKIMYVDISDPITSSTTKALLGHGIPHANSTYKSGDLYIKFTVDEPQINEDMKKQIYFALTGTEYEYNIILQYTNLRLI